MFHTEMLLVASSVNNPRQTLLGSLLAESPRGHCKHPVQTMAMMGAGGGGVVQLRTVSSEHPETSLEVKYKVGMEHGHWKQMDCSDFLFGGCSAV